MDIVVKLPDKDYSVMLTKIMLACHGCKIIELPKGHGRLIDGDKFLKDNEAYTGWILDSSDWGGENAYKDTLEDLVNDADTIIEADEVEE